MHVSMKISKKTEAALVIYMTFWIKEKGRGNGVLDLRSESK